MKISWYESSPCSLFALHYWAYTEAGPPHSQEGHSPLLALPGKGTLHITCGSSFAMHSPLRHIATAPAPVHSVFSRCTLGKWRQSIRTPQQTLVIPCSGSLLSYLPVEKIIANLACVTLEQLTEMTAFPLIFLSLFFMPRGVLAVVLYRRFWSSIKKQIMQ